MLNRTAEFNLGNEGAFGQKSYRKVGNRAGKYIYKVKTDYQKDDNPLIL